MVSLEKEKINKETDNDKKDSYYNYKDYDYDGEDKRYKQDRNMYYNPRNNSNKILIILRNILIILLSIVILLKGGLFASTRIVKGTEYDGISLEQMIENNYGEDWGKWKSLFSGKNVLTVYETKDKRVHLEFLGGVIDDIEFGYMEINGMEMSEDQKITYMSELNEKYRMDHGLPYGSDLTSTSGMYPADESSEDNSSETYQNDELEAYDVDSSLPGSGLANTGDNSDMISRLSSSTFPGSDETISNIYARDGSITYGDQFENGCTMYISSENVMGNYTFTIFCDTYNNMYYVQSVKDKDNGKEFYDNKYIGIYLDDVLNRYYGNV